MECLESRIWNNPTKETLAGLSVDTTDRTIYQKVKENWDAIAKPLDGMGRFEALTAQIGAITGTGRIDISRKAVLILCADNGIVKEGISQSGQEVTAAVAEQMGRGSSSVGKMAAAIGADTIPVDIGINRKEQIPGVLDRKIRCGTRNFRLEPAMTEEEAIRAIFTGIDLVSDCKKKGYQILATGEMGIGNTTTSSAVAAALLHCDAALVTGKGAGLDEEKMRKKKQVITEALEKYGLWKAEPLQVLECVGGLDLAGLAGVCIGGGIFHIPIVLDGMISITAALLAERLVPGTVQYVIPSHKGREPAIEMLTKELGLKPVLYGEMALGEGTGAVMMFALLEMALQIYQGKNTFSAMQMAPYERYPGKEEGQQP